MNHLADQRVETTLNNNRDTWCKERVCTRHDAERLGVHTKWSGYCCAPP
jgi:hypothetical protein